MSLPEPLPDTPRPHISRGAVVSLVLGAASPLLLFLTGVPALWVGLISLRTINAAGGRLRGRRLAVAGMVLGGLGCAASVLGLLVIVFTTLQVRSQRLECLNNLRQVGDAVLKYEDAHKAFPPGTVANADLPPDRRLSWLTTLPPFMDQRTATAQTMQARGEQLDPALAWDAGADAAVAHTAAPLFRCPADAAHDPRVTPGLTDYVGLAGVGRDAADLKRGDPMAGVFGYDRTVTPKELTAGTTRTLIVTETARDNGPWTAGGPPTVRGLDPADKPYLGPGRAFGGLHPGGLNVLWADGSADFMEDGILAGVVRDADARLARQRRRPLKRPCERPDSPYLASFLSSFVSATKRSMRYLPALSLSHCLASSAVLLKSCGCFQPSFGVRPRRKKTLCGVI